MKKLFCSLLFLLFFVVSLHAQDSNKNKWIPPFRILKTDSVYITPAYLKKNKPVMIIYFAPDCTHCLHFTYDLKDAMDKEIKQHGKTLRNTQIVMVTFAMLQSIQVFYKDLGLAKYPNIIVGTEGYTYLVQRFYQVKTTPYIAVYNRGGQLIQAFEKVPKISELLAALKKA